MRTIFIVRHVPRFVRFMYFYKSNLYPCSALTEMAYGEIADPRNPARLDEDEADYQYGVAALREDSRLFSAESVLKRYRRRVAR